MTTPFAKMLDEMSTGARRRSVSCSGCGTAPIKHRCGIMLAGAPRLLANCRCHHRVVPHAMLKLLRRPGVVVRSFAYDADLPPTWNVAWWQHCRKFECLAAGGCTAVRDFAQFASLRDGVSTCGGEVMVMSRCIVIVCAVGLSLALGSSGASSAGKGLGTPGGFAGTPPGFGSQGGHGGFEPFTPSGARSPTNLPNGWDQGQADWKMNLQRNPPVLPTCPPGLRC